MAAWLAGKLLIHIPCTARGHSAGFIRQYGDAFAKNFRVLLWIFETVKNMLLWSAVSSIYGLTTDDQAIFILLNHLFKDTYKGEACIITTLPEDAKTKCEKRTI